MTREEKNKILADKNSSENATALGGVDKDTLGKVNSTFTNSGTQTQAQGKASNQLMNYENIANKGNIVSNKTWNTINQSFKTPTAVTEADAYLKGALSKIQSGKTSYSDSVREMMDKISNRDKFSYDVDNDPLFQQALASAMNSGKSAMDDTIGQASALTGGYGSSYATSAANQAYNAFVEDAYNNLPQYYQMALDAYNAEGDELYRQLGMYQTADETEYNRMLNAYDATGTYRDRLYNEAYQQFRDSKSDAFASANLQISEHGQLSNDALNLYNAYANEADKMYEREFQKWDSEVRNAMQYAQMLNSDWWKGEEYKQADEHFYENLVHDTEEADKNRQHDIFMQEDMQAHQSNENLLDRTWKSEEADKDRQHDIFMQEDAQSFTASENAKDRATKTSSGGGKITEAKLDEIPSAIQTKAKGLKNNGDLEAYINSQVDSGAISEEQGITLWNTYAAPEQVALNERTWTVVDKGGNNYFGGIDNNAIAKDQYGNEYRMDDLYKELKKTMSAKDAKAYIEKLQKDIGLTKK